MSDIITRRNGVAGHITLNRPQALNALTWDMCTAIETAIDDWRNDSSVALIIIDGAGERAFCSGGDISDIYASAQVKDYAYAQRFWRDEYRLNAKLATYCKPVVTFLHGFTMGGGVGLGCHASHRVVCENSKIAMPECKIGLVPDVGGTLLLANAPGYIGTYLGLTGDRLNAADAIYTGFADYFISQDQWDIVKNTLAETGDLSAIVPQTPPQAAISAQQKSLDTLFKHDSLADIYTNLPEGSYAKNRMDTNSPLSMACAVPLINAVRNNPTIHNALEREYRFTHRAVEHSDFIEGIRAAIIDRDRAPKWQHTSWSDVTEADIKKMTASLGEDALNLP
ncbi:enoyl-CoA hydratase/isomerase family protein [Yoonia sp. MH D7]